MNMQTVYSSAEQRRAANYLRTRIREVNDPYLKLEVCKVTECSSITLQLASKAKANELQPAVSKRSSASPQGAGVSHHLPRVASN